MKKKRIGREKGMEAEWGHGLYEVTINFIVVIISQCIHILNYHVVFLKLTQCFMLTLIFIKLGKKLTHVIQMYREKNKMK